MTVRLPVAVRLATSRTDRHVTADLQSLSWRSTAVGGFASATLALDRPLDRDAPEIQQFGKVVVYDTRHGDTLWEGYQEDSGKGVGDDGQIWEISALGPQARAGDTAAPWIYIDQSLQRFTRTPGADVQVDSAVEPSDSDTPSVRLAIAGGTSIQTGNYFGMCYTGLYYTGQMIARCGFGWDGYGPEIAGVDYFGRVNAYTGPLQSSGSDALFSGQLSAGPGTGGPYLITTHITPGRQVVTFYLVVGGGAHPAPAGMRGRLYDFYVLGTRYLRTGSESTAAATYNQPAPNLLQAHLVFEDLLGRLLPTFDGPNASIALNAFNIDQLAYPDPVTAAQILEDLMTLEPAYRWQAWESPPLVAGGRSRVAWEAWPTSVQYEASVVDGYSAPASGADLYDSVLVRWVDANGRDRQRVRSQTVAVLTDAGIHRQASLDLGSNMGSDINAVQAGDGFLAEHAAVSAGGTLTVARPVFDRTASRMVAPWELRAGGLVRVRGLAERPDSLVAAAPDGTSVFRVHAAAYDTATAKATLELGADQRTVEAALQKLTRQQAILRRK